MIVYIDSENKCHVSNPEGVFRAIKTDFFDGKCTTFIEGYSFVPSGKTTTRPDGETFDDGGISPWRDYDVIAAAQAQYETDQAELAAAYQEGVNSV